MHASECEDQSDASIKETTILVQQNRAACLLKLDKFEEALHACDSALKVYVCVSLCV